MNRAERLAIPEDPRSPPPLECDCDDASFDRLEEVGRGGNATVYAARPRGDTERVVALKEPHVPDAAPERVVDRFRAEAETWAGLDDHPFVLSVFGWGTDPHPWIALEYADSGDLSDRLEACSVTRVLWTGTCVAAALEHAHRAGVAHLDLKPENVLLLGSDGDAWPVPKVADWGMAAFLRSETVNLEGLSLRYAAPEQFDSDRYGPVGAATDVYQLGVVLYELLVGTPPFDGPPRALREAVLEEPPPPASGRNPDLDPSVDDLLDRALAKDPTDRYDSMGAFQRALADELVDRTGLDRAALLPASVDADPTPDAGPGPDPATRLGRRHDADRDGETSPYDRALALADEGFVQLSEAYFARRDPAPTLDAWRRGVRLVDARAGRAVGRRVSTDGDDADRVPLVDRLLEQAAAGTDQVLLGPPGSGKSTVCKQVACEWFDRGYGPVFYRESGGSDRFERPDALARRVSDTDGHALVIVEDAVRSDASAAFELLERVREDDGVTVLLDARESEWREAGRGASTDGFGPDPVAAGRETLDTAYVPRPDRREHERFVRAVEAATDGSVDVDVEQLRADIRRVATSDGEANESRPGELFYLLHRLTALAGDPLADDDPPTTLTDAVADAYDRLAAAGDDELDVGVCANALNAAGVGVHPELLYAVVPDRPLAVDDAVDVLDGRALFPREADWSRGTTAYPAVHGAWSVEFLAHCLDAGEEAAARDRFGRVLTRVLGLADDEGARERVAGALDGDAPYLARIEADPTGWADDTAEAVYTLGRDRPKLAPLFGDGEYDSVTLPGACSDAVVAERPVWLGRLFLAGGYYDRAELAFERLSREDTDRRAERMLGMGRVAEERGEFDEAAARAEGCLSLVDETEPSVVGARARMQLGAALSGRGEFAAAADHYRAALVRFEGLGDRRRTAETLNGLGIATAYRNEYDRAREYFTRCLDIWRDLGNRRAVANALNNLGDIARHRSEYDRARECHERSLETRRDLGDRKGEAASLNNLGIVAEARERGFERARDYFERSLAIKRDLGDRPREANSLTNLANLCRKCGEYDSAREYQQRCLEIARELDYRKIEAASLINLGEVASLCGEYDRGREHLARAHRIAVEIDFQYGEVVSLGALGTVARLTGAYDRARECLERALDTATEIGERDERARTHYELGALARAAGEFDRARDHYECALEGFEASGDPFETTRVRLDRGRLALARGDLDLAHQRARDARESFTEMDATHWEGYSYRLLGRIAAREGETDTAREHWRAALETFEDVGAPQDALTALRHLVESACESGEGREVWCQRARETLETAPDPVTDRHGEWVARTCDDDRD